jgi:hypothetical protein
VANALRDLRDDELLRRLRELLLQSRRVEADLVAHIGEVDARRLYAREAFPSMFAWATEALHFSEGEAYVRIAVARASRQHPMLLPMLRDGRLHLTGIVKLLPHLTPENRESLLARATHKTKRQIEELIAELAPRPDVPGVMRKLPTTRPALPAPPTPALAKADRAASPTLQPRPAGTSTAPTASRPGGAVDVLAPSRYKITFTAPASLHAKLERLRALMRPSVPDGDLATLIEQAVTEKLERLEARRFARTRTPRKGLAEADTSAPSRYIPAPVRRAVYQRDGGRCRYVDESGRRCPERDNLEFHHHEKAFGRGGDHRSEGLRLMCPAHNALLAEHEYGTGRMHRYPRGGAPDLVEESCAAYSVTRRQLAGPALRGTQRRWLAAPWP